MQRFICRLPLLPDIPEEFFPCGRLQPLRDSGSSGSWDEVAHTEINDKLMGYDSSEPAGSPYGFMNDDIMDEIEEISEDEAEKYMKF